MQEKPDNEHFIPIWDCPHCGTQAAPLSLQVLNMIPPPALRAALGEHVEMEIWSCSFCDIVPDEDDEIKGYVSMADLKAMGWQEAEQEVEDSGSE